MNDHPFLACIGLGSNLGQSRRLLQAAWQALAEQPDISSQQISSPYLTRPVAMDSPHWFINAAGLLRTALQPEALLELLMTVEQQFGRIRRPEQAGYQDRTLDLDLLLFDERILRAERLILPHPAMHERMFVLAPLAEIAPQLLHPLLGKTVGGLLTELKPEAGEVRRVCWEDV